jgi:hypothetical protein
MSSDSLDNITKADLVAAYKLLVEVWRGRGCVPDLEVLASQHEFKAQSVGILVFAGPDDGWWNSAAGGQFANAMANKKQAEYFKPDSAPFKASASGSTGLRSADPDAAGVTETLKKGAKKLKAGLSGASWLTPAGHIQDITFSLKPCDEVPTSPGETYLAFVSLLSSAQKAKLTLKDVILVYLQMPDVTKRRAAAARVILEDARRREAPPVEDEPVIKDPIRIALDVEIILRKEDMCADSNKYQSALTSMGGAAAAKASWAVAGSLSKGQFAKRGRAFLKADPTGKLTDTGWRKLLGNKWSKLAMLAAAAAAIYNDSDGDDKGTMVSAAAGASVGLLGGALPIGLLGLLAYSSDSLLGTEKLQVECVLEGLLDGALYGAAAAGGVTGYKAWRRQIAKASKIKKAMDGQREYAFDAEALEFIFKVKPGVLQAKIRAGLAKDIAKIKGDWVRSSRLPTARAAYPDNPDVIDSWLEDLIKKRAIKMEYDAQKRVLRWVVASEPKVEKITGAIPHLNLFMKNLSPVNLPKLQLTLTEVNNLKKKAEKVLKLAAKLSSKASDGTQPIIKLKDLSRTFEGLAAKTLLEPALGKKLTQNLEEYISKVEKAVNIILAGADKADDKITWAMAQKMVHQASFSKATAVTVSHLSEEVIAALQNSTRNVMTSLTEIEVRYQYGLLELKQHLMAAGNIKGTHTNKSLAFLASSNTAESFAQEAAFALARKVKGVMVKGVLNRRVFPSGGVPRPASQGVSILSKFLSKVEKLGGAAKAAPWALPAFIPALSLLTVRSLVEAHTENIAKKLNSENPAILKAVKSLGVRAAIDELIKALESDLLLGAANPRDSSLKFPDMEDYLKAAKGARSIGDLVLRLDADAVDAKVGVDRLLADMPKLQGVLTDQTEIESAGIFRLGTGALQLAMDSSSSLFKPVYDNIASNGPSAVYKQQPSDGEGPNGAIQRLITILKSKKEEIIEIAGKLAQVQKENSTNKGTKIMQKNEIYNLIKEAYADNVYGQYPYSHTAGDEGQGREDYQEEWDKFSLDMLEDRTRQSAIDFSKILIKEFELLTFVLDAVGQDQSLGSEILRRMQEIAMTRKKTA